jgi:hypothetical protein
MDKAAEYHRKAAENYLKAQENTENPEVTSLARQLLTLGSSGSIAAACSTAVQVSTLFVAA